MARDRLELQVLLENILGTRNVYFQPPESMKLKYPCIVYELSRISDQKANNGSFLINKQYTVTLIDEDPDTEIPYKILELPYCRHDRRFTTENLYHDVFTLYF